MRVLWLAIGILAVLAGVVWTLQGLNILRGSFMSGHIIYTVVGLVVAVVGAALIAVGARRRAPNP